MTIDDYMHIYNHVHVSTLVFIGSTYPPPLVSLQCHGQEIGQSSPVQLKKEKKLEPKYKLPSRIDFNKCREEIAVALNEFCKRWC